MSKKITAKQIVQETNIPFYTLEYLIKCGRIKTECLGRGIERKFDPSVIDQILSIRAKRGQ